MIQVEGDARFGLIRTVVERVGIGSAWQPTPDQPVDMEANTRVQVCSLARLAHYFW
jgi:hypothetical protein